MALLKRPSYLHVVPPARVPTWRVLLGIAILPVVIALASASACVGWHLVLLLAFGK